MTYCHNLLSLLCNANAAHERFKFTYVWRNNLKIVFELYQNLSRIYLKNIKIVRRFIKEFIFSKVAGWRLAVLLIMISFLFVFQGIWFNFELFLIAVKHLFSERYPVTASNHSFTRFMFFTNVKPPMTTCWSLSTASTCYKTKIITTFCWFFSISKHVFKLMKNPVKVLFMFSRKES